MQVSDEELLVVIDVPRGSFIKRDDAGDVDFIWPLPCPFNYGHVPGTRADDGEAFDAVVLGPRLSPGSTTRVTARGRIHFVDAGLLDPKWICAAAPLSAAQRVRVETFFAVYAVAKRLLNRLRGKPGPTRYLGWL